MHEEQCTFPPSSHKTANGLFWGRGCLSNGRFAWKKWDLCSEVEINVEINAKDSLYIQTLSTPCFFYKYSHYECECKYLYQKLIAFQGLIFLRIMN